MRITKAAVFATFMAFADLASPQESGYYLHGRAYLEVRGKLSEVQEEVNSYYRNANGNPWNFYARKDLAEFSESVKQRDSLASDLKNLEEAIRNSEYSIVVDTNSLTLTLHENGAALKEYPVALGKSTPFGEFRITTEVERPTWYHKKQNPVEPGPKNPLGPLWLGFGDGYGIHGTNNPSSIGRRVTRGCIRMHEEDIREVSFFVGHGSEVYIK